MRKALKNKILLCLLIIVMAITILQGFSYAQSENLQMIKKSKEEYMIYISNLLNEEFEFAFSNNVAAQKDTLVFQKAALDNAENGNHIAYVDSNTYTQYFKNQENTYLWVKQAENYKVEAQKVNLKNALSENDIEKLNLVTKAIKVEAGQKELPVKDKNGVKVTSKIGTIIIKDDTAATYSYKIVKATDTNSKEFIRIAKAMNDLDNNKNIFEQLSIYEQFQEVYSKIMPKTTAKEWTKVEDNTIEQPENSKKGDQYLVWLKKEEAGKEPTIDVQIMDCNNDYAQNYEKQDVVIKQTTKLPITGDNIILFVIAGVILAFIIAIVVLKIKNKKDTK